MEEELAVGLQGAVSLPSPEEGSADSRAEDAGWCTGLVQSLLLHILCFLCIQKSDRHFKNI